MHGGQRAKPRESRRPNIRRLRGRRKRQRGRGGGIEVYDTAVARDPEQGGGKERHWGLIREERLWGLHERDHQKGTTKGLDW